MSEKKYRSLLKKLLNEKEETYLTTKSDCDIWFDVLNCIIFNNSLPRITEIEISQRRGYDAYYIGYSIFAIDTNKELRKVSTLKMNIRYKSKLFFVNILGHEMVHHSLFMSNYKNFHAHGKKFMEWKQAFNDNGLILLKKEY